MTPTITSIENVEFSYPIEDVGTGANGFDPMYDPGNTLERRLFGLRIHTDEGLTGEYVGGNSPAAAQINLIATYLVGKNPLRRERHWSEIKRALLVESWSSSGLLSTWARGRFLAQALRAARNR